MRQSLCNHASYFVQRLWRFLFICTVGYSGGASAVLLDRGPDLVYDTVLDITWTRQAGDGVVRSWVNSVDWANNLVFAGFDDWRLPWQSVIAGAGPTQTTYQCTGADVNDELACRDNEMGYMFYYNLDGDLNQNKSGPQTAVGGEDLTGIQGIYWSGTKFDSNSAWEFVFSDGGDAVGNVNGPTQSAWAVRAGDVVAAVPEPSSLLLIGVGMLGLGWARRARRSLTAHGPSQIG